MITNKPIDIGDDVITELGEIVHVGGIQQQHTLDAMGAKVVKEVKPMSPYVYPGLAPALYS